MTKGAAKYNRSITCIELFVALCRWMLQSGVGDTRESELSGSGSVRRSQVGAGMSRLLRQSDPVCCRRHRLDSTASNLLATLFRRRTAQQ